jgi:hypothetical protein
MAYLIRRKEPLAGEVRRILTEQNRRALVLLEHWQQNPRERVHSARQAFKRLRALLRLIRPGARYVFDVENRFYRDVARSLAYVRDTEAVIEALAVLEKDLTDPESRESLRLLRTGLQQRAARELADPVLDVPRRVQAACDALRDATGRLRRTPLPDVNRKVLRSAVRKTLRRCEQGFGQVLIAGAAADFHAWRRDVKCAYHQARLMRELMPEWAAAHGPLLARLGELLGHSQDLTVLDGVLQAQPDELGLDRRLDHLRDVIRDCQLTAQEQARQLGVQIFLQPVREPLAQAESEAALAVQAADVSTTPPSQPADDAAATQVPGFDVVEPTAQPLPANVVDFSTRRASGEE